MMDQLVFSGVLLLLSLAGAERGQDKGDTECSVELQHCVFENNIINIINNVSGLEDCRLMCKAEKDCRYITYYDSDYGIAEPFAGSCILFSQCSLYPHTQDNQCLGCVTEDTQCNTLVEPCSAPVQGQLGSNLINIVTGIRREGECREICQAEVQCNFYTYHGTQDPSYPATCFLLTRLQEPLSYIRYDFTSHFSTGSRNCDTNSEGGCFLMTAGRETTDSALVFNEVYDPPDHPAVDVVVVGSCSLTALAVGGGNDGGGGSGHIVWDQITVRGSLLLEVKVGAPARKTEVSVPLMWGGYGGPGRTTILEAEAGSYNNGDGYCGGGGDGDPGGDGGHDGGDGQPGSDGDAGGHGSGLKVADIPITKYKLSPGRGGRGGDRWGGGGGGLLVDGEGPTVHDLTDGEGYGAGTGEGAEGKPGLVILECN